MSERANEKERERERGRERERERERKRLGVSESATRQVRSLEVSHQTDAMSVTGVPR